jgi:hypothetical protein
VVLGEECVVSDDDIKALCDLAEKGVKSEPGGFIDPRRIVPPYGTCTTCDSKNTVWCWQDTDPNTASTSVLVLMEFYPNARQCLDCKAVYW